LALCRRDYVQVTGFPTSRTFGLWLGATQTDGHSHVWLPKRQSEHRPVVFRDAIKRTAGRSSNVEATRHRPRSLCFIFILLRRRAAIDQAASPLWYHLTRGRSVVQYPCERFSVDLSPCREFTARPSNCMVDQAHAVPTTTFIPGPTIRQQPGTICEPIKCKLDCLIPAAPECAYLLRPPPHIFAGGASIAIWPSHRHYAAQSILPASTSDQCPHILPASSPLCSLRPIMDQ
jgi:hypothetical protein